MDHFLHQLTTGEALMVFGVIPLALCVVIIAGTVLGLHRSHAFRTTADGDLAEPLLGYPTEPHADTERFDH